LEGNGIGPDYLENLDEKNEGLFGGKHFTEIEK